MSLLQESRLRGKVALISGAASGIGKAIALRYAQEGARVAIADLNGEQAETTAAQIRSEGGEAIAVTMDVTDESAIDQGVEKVINQWDRLDIVVSNAGIQIVKPVETFSLTEWKRMLSIHLDGAFLITRAALRFMYEHEGGTLIYMGSVHSHEASKLKAPYVTAKHGLLGLARTVAKEGAAHNVRANVICPGFVRTPLVDKQIPEQAEALGISEEEVIRDVMLKETVDHTFTTLEDIAETALYIAAFPSNALTGQSMVVSHGWSMH